MFEWLGFPKPMSGRQWATVTLLWLLILVMLVSELSSVLYQLGVYGSPDLPLVQVFVVDPIFTTVVVSIFLLPAALVYLWLLRILGDRLLKLYRLRAVLLSPLVGSLAWLILLPNLGSEHASLHLAVIIAIYGLTVPRVPITQREVEGACGTSA